MHWETFFVAKQRLLTNIFKGHIRRWRLGWWCRTPDKSLQQIKRSGLCHYLCKPYQSKTMQNQAKPLSTPGLQRRFIATPVSMPAEGLIIVFKRHSKICNTFLFSKIKAKCTEYWSPTKWLPNLRGVQGSVKSSAPHSPWKHALFICTVSEMSHCWTWGLCMHIGAHTIPNANHSPWCLLNCCHRSPPTCIGGAWLSCLLQDTSSWSMNASLHMRDAPGSQDWNPFKPNCSQQVAF